MERETIVVTGAMIMQGGRVLLSRRHSTSRFEPGKWEFPGGKVDFGEHPAQTIVREIQEELGVDIDVLRLYDVSDHVYSDARGERHVILLFYQCRLKNGIPAPLDCAEVRTFSKEQMVDLPIVAGDIAMVRRLTEDPSVWIS